MKLKQKFYSFLSAFLFLSSLSFAGDQTYVIDNSHTMLNFEVDHLVISTATGRFDNFNGEIITDAKGASIKKISGTVEASSINTGNNKRDKHLRSEDFFNTKKFPELTFDVENLNLNSSSRKKHKATLKIRGVSKQVEFDFHFKGKTTDPWGTEKIVIKAYTTINRKDFGLQWNEALETGGVMVGEEVRIEISAQADLKTN